MTPQMVRCAEEIRLCWRDCDVALLAGDGERANAAFGRAFEVVDACPAIAEDDVRTLRFLCVLTWVKVATALDNNGQADSAEEARQQVFSLLDEMFNPPLAGIDSAWTPLSFVAGLESEESADLVGRLYLLCSQAGRKDALLWGRCFMRVDDGQQAAMPPVVQ